MRLLQALMIGLFAMTGAVPEVRAQEGYDRPGGDYLNFAVRGGDPAACAARCERESRCRAWSFSYPSNWAGAICWLKSAVTAPVENDCCTSGVRGAAVVEPRNAELEVGIDRQGGDYRNFDTPPDPSGAACAAACKADNRCRAWTYVRPGYIGPGARCFLKSQVKAPRRKPCCISGVVR